MAPAPALDLTTSLQGDFYPAEFFVRPAKRGGSCEGVALHLLSIFTLKHSLLADQPQQHLNQSSA